MMACVFAMAQSQPSHRTKEPPKSEPRKSIELRRLLSPDDPLAQQDLTFDASFAQLSLQYLGSGDAKVLDQLAKSAPAAHILSHARNFDYEVPKTSTAELVAHLLTPRAEHQKQADTCGESLEFFMGPMLEDPHWVNDTLRYLPDDFQFHGSLFLTFGYDIGVAFPPAASLNCGHSHFAGHTRELEYYAIHELHHLGFMSYQPPPHLGDIKSCGDLLQLVQYSTQLEGMAVWAVYERRRAENALNDDDDYVALQDAARMRRDEELYIQDLNYLRTRAAEPADSAAWAVVERMSSGERLWYRVGARMAQRIEQASGRAALVALIKSSPASFLQAYQRATAASP